MIQLLFFLVVFFTQSAIASNSCVVSLLPTTELSESEWAYVRSWAARAINDAGYYRSPISTQLLQINLVTQEGPTLRVYFMVPAKEKGKFPTYVAVVLNRADLQISEVLVSRGQREPVHFEPAGVGRRTRYIRPDQP